LNASILSRPVSVFILFFTIVALVSWQGVKGLRDVNNALRKVYTQQIPPLKTVSEVLSSFAGWNRSVMDRLLDVDGRMVIGDTLEYSAQVTSRALRGLVRLGRMQGLTEEERELVREVQQGISLAVRIHQHVLERMDAGNQEEAYRLFRQEFSPLLAGMEVKLEGVFQVRSKRLMTAWTYSEQGFGRGIRRICWTLAFFFVFTFVVLLLMTWKIRDRKQAEDALRASEREKEVILDSMSDRVVQYDREKRILWANHVAAEYWRVPPEALSGHRCEDLEDVCIEGCESCPVERTLKTGNHEEGEVRTPDGKVWMVQCNKILDEKGEMIGVLEVSRDITEKKKFEEELLKTQKLESIGNLAGGVAHHFNNLLTGIVGNIDLAKMDTDPGSRICQRLERAEDAVFRAKDLTSRLVAFSSAEKPVKRMVSIWELLKNTSDFALSGSSARCEQEIQRDLWPVELDEVQMTQALGALISNASQAMEEKGVIRICAENVHARSEVVHPVEKGMYVRIRVEDQGPGILKENLARIFEPFFTTKDRASGLGLYSAHSIIKSHKGTLTVDSDFGRGSVFSVYLPAIQKELAEKKPEPRKEKTLKGKVLVMDDEEMIRKSLGEMLERLGFDVEMAQEGQEAVALYEKAGKMGNPYDVVILDLTIPGGMGGREALERIRKIDPKVRAIVSSGYSRDPVLTRYWEFGFRGAVPKPYRFKDLRDTLEDILET
jgi:signal transduction histidine kinase/CheY-like chemotaxis protein/preprotein translocase subunit SecG